MTAAGDSRLLAAATVVTPAEVFTPGWIALTGGRVASAGEGRPPLGRRGAAPIVELGERIVAPGYFDVHVHGGDGAQVNAGTEEEAAAGVERLARFHARHGTTSLLATTVSASPSTLIATVAGAGALVGRALPGAATVRGVHLEGPFIARAKLGAQDPAHRRLPDIGELRALAEAAGGNARIVTIAPELAGSDRLMDTALELGMRVAVGHSDASYDTTRAAIEAGARHATHLFNAMAPLHHRRPGAITALLLDDRVSLEIVADLEHLHPAVIALVARSAPGRLVAVSDAVAAAGFEAGTYRLGDADIAVESGASPWRRIERRWRAAPSRWTVRSRTS